MKTLVVNCRKERYDVYIGRPSIFGNPFREGSRTQVIDQYRQYFQDRIKNDPVFRKAVLSLRGKILGCFCAPRPCHGDVIVDWIENEDET